MNEDERWFCCPRCQLRIGEIENDGALLMYPGVRTMRAFLVCLCGNEIHWQCHEDALDTLVARVRKMRGSIGSPCRMLT